MTKEIKKIKRNKKTIYKQTKKQNIVLDNIFENTQ